MFFFIREMFFNYIYQYFMQYITYRLFKDYYFLLYANLVQYKYSIYMYVLVMKQFMSKLAWTNNNKWHFKWRWKYIISTWFWKKKLACRRQYNSVISALSKIFKTISVNRSDVKKDCTPFIPVYILNLKSVTKFCINSIILKISFQRQFEIGTLNYCFIWIWMFCQRIFNFFKDNYWYFNTIITWRKISVISDDGCAFL